MADNQIEFEVLARTEKAAKSVEDFVSQVKTSLSGAQVAIGLTAINQGLDLAKKLYDETKKIIEKPFELAIEGEKIKSLETQFELLSSQAQVMGDSLKSGLEKASGGLADTTSILQAANRAFIELGKNADHLPQTMELARKATIAFGGNLIENFENINQAIATGNTRALRALGLTIDRDKAEKDFAKSIGVSVGVLSEAGRQHAILNAVLEKGNTSFKNINDQTLQTTNAWTQLNVAIKEASDNFKASFSTTFGPALETVAKGFTNFFRDLTGTQPLTIQLQQVNKEIEHIKEGGPAYEASMGGALASLNAKAKTLKDQLDLVNIAADDARKASRFTPGGGEATTTFADPAQLEAQRLKIQELFRKTHEDQINAQLAQAELEGNYDEQERLRFEQRLLVIREFGTREAALKKDYLDTGLITKAQYDVLEEQMEDDKQARIAAMAEKANTTLLSIRKSLQDGLVNVISSSISTIVTNLVKGENAFKDFGKVILKLLGGLAIQIGTMILAAGIAKLSLITDLAGGPTIIAGAALIAIGAALEAFAGGGGSSDTAAAASASSSGGGLAGLSGPGSSSVAGISDINKITSGTTVNVNISGNVLDRRQTGLEIAEVLQEHFNNNGNLIVGST